MTATAPRDGWVLSPRGDLVAFGGPVLVAAAVAAVAAAAGRLDAEVPPLVFLLVVVGVDVAHVWATAFRVPLDGEARARAGGLLVAVPLGCLVVGVALHAAGPAVFWRALAYVAVFHFVRQPWGFMAYAARRAGETSALDRRLDWAAVHVASLHPVVWWHTRLPRSFAWFVDGDFAPGLPPAAATVSGAVAATVLGAWVLRQAALFVRFRAVNRGKALVLGSTVLTWHGGIVLLDSDLVFTVSNVLAHGVPYVLLVRRYGVARFAGRPGVLGRLFSPAGALGFGALLVAVAWLEEALWDAAVWHQRAALFPLPRLALDADVLDLVVPLLALPQATHYVLDAFVWRARRDPGLRAALGFSEGAGPPAAPAGASPPRA